MTAELNYYTVARGFTRSLLIYCVFSILEKNSFRTQCSRMLIVTFMMFALRDSAVDWTKMPNGSINVKTRVTDKKNKINPQKKYKSITSLRPISSESHARELQSKMFPESCVVCGIKRKNFTPHIFHPTQKLPAVLICLHRDAAAARSGKFVVVEPEWPTFCRFPECNFQRPKLPAWKSRFSPAR